MVSVAGLLAGAYCTRRKTKRWAMRSVLLVEQVKRTIKKLRAFVNKPQPFFQLLPNLLFAELDVHNTELARFRIRVLA